MAAPSLTRLSSDFSTNRHAPKAQEAQIPTRHTDICFNDGNIVILAGSQYSLVHQGLLSRHSEVLNSLITALDSKTVRYLEGRPVLQLQDSPEDAGRFLQALYDGINSLEYDGNNFTVVSGLLRLFTKYRVLRLRKEILCGLSASWPSTLSQWEARESKATDASGVYAPRHNLPHPIMVIGLAHEVGAIELLPSAFYDLSRSLPSQAAVGFPSSATKETLQLSDQDLLNVLRGREHASRFLSTFIVNELEGRDASEWCIHREEQHNVQRRACQIAFEAITFELLRDVNGIVCNRNSDPLYAIQDSELMQTRDDAPGTENVAPYRACEACRTEFSAVVEAARMEFWAKLPQWFGVDLPNWG